MKKNILFKLGASLLVMMLLAACNNAEDEGEDTGDNTEQTETEDGAAEEEATE